MAARVAVRQEFALTPHPACTSQNEIRSHVEFPFHLIPCLPDPLFSRIVSVRCSKQRGDDGAVRSLRSETFSPPPNELSSAPNLARDLNPKPIRLTMNLAIDDAATLAKLPWADLIRAKTAPDTVTIHVSRPAPFVSEHRHAPETPPQRWQRLMLAAQAGEKREYATLLKEASVFIRAIARRHHREPTVIEDVVQETLTSIHRMRHTYEPGRPVEPWIAAIAKARSIDVLRTRMRRNARETHVPGETLALHADPGISPESDLASRSVIAEALSNLTDAQRSAIQLLKIEELSLAEASTVSGLSVQALMSIASPRNAKPEVEPGRQVRCVSRPIN